MALRGIQAGQAAYPAHDSDTTGAYCAHPTLAIFARNLAA